MQTLHRWLGAAVRPQDLSPGSLFLAHQRNGSLLVLATHDPHGEQGEVSGVVLAEYGTTTGDPVPRLVYVSGLQPATRFLRVIDGLVVVEPADSDIEKLVPTDDNAKNGSLLTLANGAQVVVTKQSARGLQLWDLQSGERVDPAAAGPHVILHNWKLSWRSGDDDKLLCVVKAQ